MRDRGQLERHLATAGRKLRCVLMGAALALVSCGASPAESAETGANQPALPVTDSRPPSTARDLDTAEPRLLPGESGLAGTEAGAPTDQAHFQETPTTASAETIDVTPAADEVETAEADESAAADDQQSTAFPQVTFPEATVRDPQAEAADRQRRQSVIGLFERLRIEAEHRTGYSREAVFGGWLYSDGQSTRDRVLASERLPDGSWYSAYDSVIVLSAGELDIDHVVPLAEAWESGGHRWSAETWTRFGNDLEDPRSLVAVSASTNRSKGAKDPQDWWPPHVGYRCQYAADWIAIKARWNLTVDAAEHGSLDAQIESCSGADFDYGIPSSAAVALDEATTEPQTESSATPESESVRDASDEPADGCHPAYEPCLPNVSGDALNCGDLTADQKPVRVKEIGVDPYRLDRDRNGEGCIS